MNWTKVTDALPHDGEAVMVTVFDRLRNKKYVSICAHMFSGFWNIFGGEIIDDRDRVLTITHWAPMPAPAEDER